MLDTGSGAPRFLRERSARHVAGVPGTAETRALDHPLDHQVAGVGAADVPDVAQPLLLRGRLEAEVAATFKQAESFGKHAQQRLHEPEPLFDDVYRERSPETERQIAEWQAGRGP